MHLIVIDFTKIPLKLSADYVLSKIDDAQIFYRYFGPFEVGNKSYSSVFRKDRTPSTGFYLNKKGRLIYNDLKTGEKLDCFAYVGKLNNIGYGPAVRLVAQDFGLIDGNAKFSKVDFTPIVKTEKRIIQIYEKPFDAEDRAYWRSYHITSDELRRENVFSVSRLFLDKREIFFKGMMFAYVVFDEKGEQFIKIYAPFGKQKWLSNIPLSLPFGLSTLKWNTGPLAIGKAQKDRIILQKYFPNVLGTQNESEAALPVDLRTRLLDTFDPCTIIWDNDPTGVENCTKLNKEGFHYFNVPKYLLDKGIKDISDYAQAFGLKALERLFKSKKLL